MGRFKYLALLLAVSLLIPAPSVYSQGQEVSLLPLDNTLSNGTVTVTTSATAIPTTALSGRRSIAVVNTSSGAVFLGDSNVTTSNGFQVKQDEKIALDIGDSVTLYGIVASGTSDMRYLEAR